MFSFYQKFSSPLKIILTGEHSVVYSKNAIAAAINLRYYCEIQEIQQKPPIFSIFFNEKKIESFTMTTLIKTIDEISSNYKSNLPEYKVFMEKTQENIDFWSFCNDKDLFYVYLSLFMESFSSKSRESLYKYFEDKTCILKISTKVPDLTGVGSSASYLSVITACLLKYFKYVNKIVYKEESPEDFKCFIDLVNQKTFNFEKIYHSTPSGIDNTVIVNGGLILYNKGSGMQFLKSNFISLFFDICIVNTKISKNTKNAVESVRKIYEASEEGKQNIDKIGVVSDQIFEILIKDVKEEEKEEIVEKFAQLIQINQKLLAFFELCNKKIDQFIEISKMFGVISKITGSGQGGCCLAFLRKMMDSKRKKEFIQELEKNDFEVIEIELSSEGLRDETK